MRRLALVVAGTLSAASLAAMPATTALACTCAMVTYDEALAGSDAALVGVVVDIGDSSVGADVWSSGDVLQYTVLVEEPIKGRLAKGDEVIVGSARGGASCGQEMAMGQRWRLLLYTAGDDFMTTLCSGNELLAAKVPTPSQTPDQSDGLLMVLPALLGVFGLPGAVVAFVLLRWIGVPRI